MKITHATQNGMKIVATLPKEYGDGKAKVTMYQGALIVTHPDREPLKVTLDGKIEVIKPIMPREAAL